MLAVAYLLLFFLSGYVLMCWQFPQKEPVVRGFLGMGVGLALAMCLPALCALAFDFTLAAHGVALVLLALVLALGFFTRNRGARLCPWDGEQTALLGNVLVFALPFTLLGLYLQHTHVLMPAQDGSLWCGQSTYGDLNLHLAIATSLRNASFPPDYSLLADTRLGYPFLADSLSTTMMLLGLDLRTAIILPGTVMMFMVFAGYILLARRVLGKGRMAVAMVAGLFFFLPGGMGFLYDIDRIGKDSSRFAEIFTGYYMTPANRPSQNLRWSNIIADLLVPQRTLLGGWAVLIPALYLLLDAVKEKTLRGFIILGMVASCLPLLHTHSFLALALFSFGLLLYTFVHEKKQRRRTLLGAGVYLGVTLLLSLPQLIDFAFKQTLEGGVIRFQFNWVNNSGNNGMIDEYFFFWIKNMGVPFLLFVCALLEGNRRKRANICAGAMCIFAVAELVLFQRNEYDNNKLFYVAYMFMAMLAADWAGVVWRRLEGLRSRRLLAALVIFCSIFSGSLSIARECVSRYQLFNADAVAAAKYIEEETPEHSMFMTGQQHINPVSALCGRDIVCGPDLYLYFHGLDYTDKERECQAFYADPYSHLDTLEKYGVAYIYVSDYELAEMSVDTQALDALFEKVYQQGWVTIYAVGDQVKTDG